MAEETKDVKTPSEEPERTFTQSELNAILGDRLAQERKKYADFEAFKEKAEAYDKQVEASKSELEKAIEERDKYKKEYDALKAANELRQLTADVARETGIDASILRGSTREELEAHANLIKNAFGQAKYPTVKDSGEVHVPTATKEEILSIKDDKKRLKAIKENIELFQKG